MSVELWQQKLELLPRNPHEKVSNEEKGMTKSSRDTFSLFTLTIKICFQCFSEEQKLSIVVYRQEMAYKSSSAQGRL